MTDDRDDEYLADADRELFALRRELAELRVKVAALERDLGRLDVYKTREQLAVLQSRIDGLQSDAGGVRRRLGDLSLLVAAVLFVSLLQLGTTLATSLR